MIDTCDFCLSAFEVYAYCNNCKCSYHINNDGKHYGWQFIISYKKMHYFCQHFYDSNYTHIYCGNALIKTFSGKTDITPQNFLNKLKTILTFL